MHHHPSQSATVLNGTSAQQWTKVNAQPQVHSVLWRKKAAKTDVLHAVADTAVAQTDAQTMAIADATAVAAQPTTVAVAAHQHITDAAALQTTAVNAIPQAVAVTMATADATQTALPTKMTPATAISALQTKGSFTAFRMTSGCSG